MINSANPRTRLVTLLEILSIYSDEYNLITADEILIKLSEYGHKITKRTLNEDLKLLKEAGENVIYISSKGYYLAKEFDKKTLYILQKAVFSSPIVSEEETEYVENIVKNTFGEMTWKHLKDTTINANQRNSPDLLTLDENHALREAIIKNKQVMLTVTTLEPGDKFSTAKREKKLIVNPFALGIANNSFSLAFTCPSTPSKPEYIRIRRITSVKLLDCPQNRKYDGSLDSCRGYFDSVPAFAFGLKSGCVMFRMKKEDLEYVDHILELPVEYRKDEKEGYCLAKINTIFNGRLVGCLFHLRNKIELIQPKTIEELI